MKTFVMAVHQYFDDLAAVYSMHCVEENESHVRYENELVSLAVGWDKIRSYEVGVGMRLKSDTKGHFSIDLWDLLRYLGETEAAFEIGGLSVNRGQDFSGPIEKLSTLTQMHAQGLLKGDPEAFTAVDEFRKHKRAALQRSAAKG